MSKIKINDPCSCGSGIKYKKCCGNDNVIALTPSLYTDELEHLHEEFIQFAFEEFEDELLEVTQQFAVDNIDVNDDEELNTFTLIVLAWSMFNVPLEQNKTAFDFFYAKINQSIQYPAVKHTFAKWENSQPGVFEVFPEEKQISLINLATDDTLTTSLNPKRDYRQGDLQ